MPAPKVSVLPAALVFMRRMVKFSDHPGGGFRLRVESGGCNGYSCKFTVEAQPCEDDEELALDGLRLFIPAECCELLDGGTVDFADTALQSGLSVTNPNAGACACSAMTDSGAPNLASVALSSIRRL